MPTRSSLPDDVRGVPFTRKQSLVLQISPGRLRASDIDHPFHGVHREVGAPKSTAWQCRAYLLRMQHGVAFSHATAARLYGMPLPAYVDSTAVHVTRKGGSRPPEGRGISGHEVADALWMTRSFLFRDPENFELFELPVLAPALVWAQLASSLDADDLVALGDAMLQGNEPLCTIRDFELQTVLWRGRRGARTIANAVGRVRFGSLSRPESLQRLQVVRAGIPEPQLNVVVSDLTGSDIAMADEVWAEFRTLVEYEGDDHRTSRSKFRSDITRFERYADGDWSALRSQAGDVFDDPNPFVKRLWRRLVARGWQPPRREPRHISPARR